NTRRSAKLAQFNELFRAMFIDRHPGYSLYRHWYDLTDNAPEFPAPPTDEPTPRIETEVPETEYGGSRYAEDSVEERPSRRRLSPLLMGLGGLGILIVLLLLSGILNPPASNDIGGAAVTLSDTPDAGATTTAAALL